MRFKGRRQGGGEALAPRARDIIGAESDWQMASNLHASLFFSRASIAAATERGETYSIRDYGVSSRIGSQLAGTVFSRALIGAG